MCVIFLAYEQHPDFPLIMLANRDEFYNRPTAKATAWEDDPKIFGGRDLIGGGTWLGITESGKVSAVTNYREPGAPAGSVSRGRLVSDFLRCDAASKKYLTAIAAKPNDYSGFNLLAGKIGKDKSEIFYYSNREDTIRELQPGIYGLSNSLLDTPWPKIVKGKLEFERILSNGPIDKEAMFAMLGDKELAADADLPDTGIGYEKEKLLSPIFIETPIYGTRCSTVVTGGRDGKFEFEERVFV